MFRKFILPLIVVLTLLLGACAPAATPASTEAPAAPAGITLTDGLGREIKLAAPAQRVISMAPSLTEVLFAVGAGGQTIGRDEMSNFPEAALSVASIGSTYQALNTEAILALNPDLIVAADFTSPEQIKALEDLNLTVYVFKNPVDFDGMYQDLKTMGQLTGHEAEAAQLVESLQARVAAVDQQIAGVTEKPTVFYEIDGSDPTKPWTSGPNTFMDTLITRAGGINIGGALTDPFAQISLEEIVKQDPTFIVLGDVKLGVTVESVGARQGWSELTAVKESRVFPFDDDLSSRPGPRLVDGLEALAKLLHPELFK